MWEDKIRFVFHFDNYYNSVALFHYQYRIMSPLASGSFALQMSKRKHYAVLFGSASSVRPIYVLICVTIFAVLYAFTHYNCRNGRFLMSVLHLLRNLRFQWGPFSGKF